MIATLFGELTHDELPDYTATVGIALLPLCCMLVRHVAVWVLRLRRQRTMAAYDRQDDSLSAASSA